MFQGIKDRLKAVNILLFALSLPLSAFVARDYLAYSLAPRRAAMPGTRDTAPSEPDRDLLAYAPIAESSAFPSKTGRLVAIESIEASGSAGAPPVFADLRLLGTFVRGVKSFAIFEKTGSPQSVFKIGEKVFEAGPLKSVTLDKAVVSVGPRDVSFTIKDEPLPERSGALPTGAGPATEPGERPRPGGPRGPMSRKISENEWAIDQGALVNSLNNISTVLTDARMTPKVANGAVEGFLVTEIKPRGVFDAVGLKNGDVLKRINGFDIDTPEKAVQVLSGLKGETRMEIDLVRGGKNMNFHYEIR
ncbi:MAG: hypothetical protein HYV24_04310 [Deltaproteobacteria bacterium]|nr:hypothetical protein [Deltaproteobacteria bacterium]